MKLTVKNLYDILEGLNDLMEKELPTSVAFSIQRNYKKVNEEVKSSEEVRKRLIDKYKSHDNGDGTVQLKKDKIKDYEKEHKELMEQELEIDLKELMLNELGETIQPKTLGLLEPIIKEDN